jgi:hypothetical protein
MISLDQISNPPQAKKESNPLRFGILGAANIAPIALILPSRSHPDAKVTAVAARNEQKARTFAKKHGIETVYYGPTGYQGSRLLIFKHMLPLTLSQT